MSQDSKLSIYGNYIIGAAGGGGGGGNSAVITRVGGGDGCGYCTYTAPVDYYELYRKYQIKECREQQLREQHPGLQELWEKYQIMLKLVEDDLNFKK